MARGVALGSLIEDLKREARMANSAATSTNMRSSLVHLIQRTQETLWQQHDWSFLKIRRDKVLQAGENIYSFFSDLDFGRITNVMVKHDGQWFPVRNGITMAHYNSIDPELDERQDPVLFWSEYEDNQFEVWPMPATDGAEGGNGVLRFFGIKNLDALVSETDTATLDDRLIVLFAAAEVMAGAGQKDAAGKLSAARTLLEKLIGQHDNKREPFIMGGCNEDSGERKIRVLYTTAGQG